MPESKVQGTHFTEAGLLRRLNDYRINQLGINPIRLADLVALEKGASEPKGEIAALAAASISENSVRAYLDSKSAVQIPVNIMNDNNEVCSPGCMMF